MTVSRRGVRTRIALAASLLAAPALAQDEAAPPPAPRPDLAEATEILVIATRSPSATFDVPYSTGVVGAAEIRGGKMPRTLPDAIADLPGVMVQKTSYGQASPFVRGFTGYQTLMLVDGIRLNNSTFRSGPNQYWGTVDAYSVERVEVVRGPTSVLFGSDAVGGAVNAVARRRSTFEPGLHVDGRVLGRFASAEHSEVYRAEAEGNQDDLGFAVGASYKGFGDLVAGGDTGLQEDTGYRERDGDLRLDWRESPCATWTLGAQRVEQDDVPRTHRTVYSVSFHGTTLGDELRRDIGQGRTLVYVRHARELDAPLAERLELTVSWQEQTEDQHRDREGGKTDLSGYDVDTWGLQVQLGKSTDFGALTYGAEYWHDSVSSYRRDYVDGVLDLERVQGAVADDASYDLVGVYAQDEFGWGATRLTAGARFTYAAAEADRVDDPTVQGGDPARPGNVISLDDSWTNVVGSLRALHPLAAGWNVHGGVSQGFRAPNLSDLTRLDDTSGVETPSLGLDPEEYVQFEAGLKAERPRWSGSASVWYTDIRDMIVASPTGSSVGSTPEVRKDNVGDGYVAGVEVEVAWRIDDSWTLSGAGTWQRGTVDQVEPDGRVVSRPLSRVMPLTGIATLAYRETPESPWWAWASTKAADAQDRLSLKDETDTERIPPGGTPGWFVLSVGVGFEIVEDTATLSIALENVGDVDYRIHGSGVNEPGRNLVVGLDVRF